MNYIIILGVFQAFVSLSLFMVFKRSRPSENILTLLLLCIFTHLSLKFFIYAYSDVYEFKAGFNTFTDLAYGPLIWLYVNKIKSKRLSVIHLTVFLPSLAAGVFYIYLLVNGVGAQDNFREQISIYNKITGRLIPLSFLVFPILTINMLRSIATFWNAEKVLVRSISLLFLIMGVISFSLDIAGSSGLISIEPYIYPVRVIGYSIMLLISLLILRYKLISVIQQSSNLSELAESLPGILVDEKTLVLEVPKIDECILKKFSLTEEKRVAIAEQIKSLMLQKKLYTDSELSLEKLSNLAQIPRHHLSEVFNQHLGKSFYQVINEYRVKEVIRLLDEYKRRDLLPNILVIAFEAGFNSKSTFNQYFRKTTGMTPSEYLKRDDVQVFSGMKSPAFSV